jgi:uncharacterized LabA/DUF88 family protein
MFRPATVKIGKLAEVPGLKAVTANVERLFRGNTHIYIDFANVRPWSEKLEWHIDSRRLKQFLDSFEFVKNIKWYQGELVGDIRSTGEIKKLRKCKYTVRTKPVKIMQLSIDMTSISKQSPDLLKKFVRRSLLRKYDIETVEFLNERFAGMNARGEFYIEDRKCNFDVEIGTDMRIDSLSGNVGTFVLWSGDSDFADTIKTLLGEKKRVVLFATAGRVSRELNDLRKDGLMIFDVFHLKEFICWPPEQSIQVELPEKT